MATQLALYLTLFVSFTCTPVGAASVPQLSSLTTSSSNNVTWRNCSETPDNPRFQRAIVKVRLDYTQGWKGGEAEAALSKWITQGRKHGNERKSLFVNPGGPGARTIFNFQVAAPLSEVVLDMYDITVSFAMYRI